MKKMRTLALSAATLFTLAACGNKADDQADKVEDKVEETTEQKEETKDETVDIKDMHSTEFMVAIEDAVDIFLKEFGDESHVESIEFELEDDKYVYDVSGWGPGKEYQAKIDAQTGDILNKEEENDDEEGEVLVIPDVISPQEAMKIALKDSKGDYVESWELSLEDGRMIYEIDVNEGDDVTLDAITGDVLADD